LSEVGKMLQVTQVDLSYFFRTKWLLATLIGLNITDMLVVGLVYNNMMDFNYFQFYVPGVIIVGLFFASFDVGRRVHLGLSEGVSQYYLTLPVSLNALVLAHLLSAGLGGLIYAGILIVIAGTALMVAHLPTLLTANTLMLLPFLFLLSMGLAGVAAVLNLFSKAGDRYWVFADGIQTALVGLSTVAYPLRTMTGFSPPVLDFIEYNPLSQGVEALRTVVNGAPSNPIFNFPALLLGSLILLGVGVVSYRHVFTRLRDTGRI
jgi:ABC-type polysaccharide/polyol phosphate export permease